MGCHTQPLDFGPAYLTIVGSGRYPEWGSSVVVLHVHRSTVDEKPLDGLLMSLTSRDVQTRVSHAVLHVDITHLSRNDKLFKKP